MSDLSLSDLSLWRDTMRPIRFFGLDARVLIAFLLLLAAPYRAVLVISVVLVGFFSACAVVGFTPPTALRALRARLAGKRTSFRPRMRRRLVDYGGIFMMLALTLSCAPAWARFVYVTPPPLITVPPAHLVEPVGNLPMAAPPSAQDLPPITQTRAPAQSLSPSSPVSLLQPVPKPPVPEPPAAEPADPRWQAVAGASLIDTLSDWGHQGDVRVIAQTDRDWTVAQARTMGGALEVAAQHLVDDIAMATPGATRLPVISGGPHVLIIAHQNRGGIVP